MKFTIGAFLALSMTGTASSQGILGSLFKGSGDSGKDKANEDATAPTSTEMMSPMERLLKERKVISNRKNIPAEVHSRRLQSGATTPDLTQARPLQTFYIPLPENDVFFDMFRIINGHQSNGQYNVRGNMISLISVAVSTDYTVIWYDHWEDQYEEDLKSPTSTYTEIWGDGNAANGCSPDVTVCTDANDYLMAGSSFVIENSMAIPRTSTNWFESGIKYDGGDKLQASFPITMTRGEYAEYPGSLLAGGVEILETDLWGTSFIAPVGTNTPWGTQAFEYSRLFLMSSVKGNEVTLPSGVKTVLNEGQSISISVKEGDKITSKYPIQVNLAIGDIDSNYELRWYSILSTDKWSNEYMSSVGDTISSTRNIVYNPADTLIKIDFKYYDGSSEKTLHFDVNAKMAVLSPVVPTGSGCILKSANGEPFIALAMIDAQDMNSDGTTGRTYDWGFPLVPVNKLTPQILVGWGYGCTANDCDGKTERSAVWISPIQDADVYVDFQNTGINPYKWPGGVKRLHAIKVRDTLDHDMSGAVIFATLPNTGTNGPPVDIAAAWGQDPVVSLPDQQYSLDLGTVVPPFTTLRSKKEVDKKVASTSDVLTYTISIQNVGQSDVSAGGFTVNDPLMPQGSYVKGSARYSIDGCETFYPLPDDTVGQTLSPLDEGGLPSQAVIERRGGVHCVQFQFKLDPELLVDPLVINEGKVIPPYGPELPYKAVTELVFQPEIIIENKVYKGDDGDLQCKQASEVAQGIVDSLVTYCFTVKNTGLTALGNIRLTDPDVGAEASHFTIPPLNPGESILVTFVSTIGGNFDNTAKVVATPIFSDGSVMGIPDVAAADKSAVELIDYAPAVTIENTVYSGYHGIHDCHVAGVEKVVGSKSDPVTYCFKVINTGNTHLTNVVVTNPTFDYTRSVVDLAPGESTMLSLENTIPGALVNIATVKGTPASASASGALSPIAGLNDVSSTDPSEVGETVSGTTRSGDKAAFQLPETCMQTNWEDAGNSQNLVCRAKEVYLDEVISERMQCTEGEMITVSLTASVHFNAARYDPGWYVAVDGGDALTGHCTVHGLVVGNEYKVTAGHKQDEIVGRVSWNEDEKGENDQCGDVLMDGGGGCNIVVPFIESKEMKCVDQNNDGTMDFSVCFSWRVPGKDGTCTLKRSDPLTLGNEADLYPATPAKCFCTRYDIPTITVKKPETDHVSTC